MAKKKPQLPVGGQTKAADTTPNRKDGSATQGGANPGLTAKHFIKQDPEEPEEMEPPFKPPRRRKIPQEEADNHMDLDEESCSEDSDDYDSPYEEAVPSQQAPAKEPPPTKPAGGSAKKTVSQAATSTRKTTSSMASAYKIDLLDKLPDYPIEKIRSRYVSVTLWKHSGVIIRIINCNTPDLPSEVGVLRLQTARIEHVPAILTKERATVKSWALTQVTGSLREAGCNIGMDEELTPDEWSVRYVVSSLSRYGRRMLGPGEEPGLWVLHCPEFIEEAVRARFDDGSEDRCHIIKMYINLVAPEFRIRKIDGGWAKKEEPDPEVKRPYSVGRGYSRPYRSYMGRPRPYMDANQVANRAAMILEARQKSSAPAMNQETFPDPPTNKNVQAIHKMLWPETDIPNISCSL